MKKILFLIAGLSLLVMVGCTSTPKANQEKDVVCFGPPLKNPLYLPRIVDMSTDYPDRPLNINSDPLLLIPLWPYAKTERDPVMRYNSLQNSVRDSLEQQFAIYFRSSGMFTSVLAADQANPNLKAPANAYRLLITLNKAVWMRNLTTYGLSSAGGVLWIFLPVSYGSVTIDLTAVLKDPSGKELGRKKINKKIGCTEWIYDQLDYRPAKSESRMVELLPVIISDLREFVAEKLKPGKKK